MCHSSCVQSKVWTLMHWGRGHLLALCSAVFCCALLFSAVLCSPLLCSALLCSGTLAAALCRVTRCPLECCCCCNQDQNQNQLLGQKCPESSFQLWDYFFGPSHPLGKYRQPVIICSLERFKDQFALLRENIARIWHFWEISFQSLPFLKCNGISELWVNHHEMLQLCDVGWLVVYLNVPKHHTIEYLSWFQKSKSLNIFAVFSKRDHWIFGLLWSRPDYWIFGPVKRLLAAFHAIPVQ